MFGRAFGTVLGVGLALVVLALSPALLVILIEALKFVFASSL